jgi:hypothetical protein
MKFKTKLLIFFGSGSQYEIVGCVINYYMSGYDVYLLLKKIPCVEYLLKYKENNYRECMWYSFLLLIL